jgi:hypothetical protein
LHSKKPRPPATASKYAHCKETMSSKWPRACPRSSNQFARNGELFWWKRRRIAGTDTTRETHNGLEMLAVGADYLGQVDQAVARQLDEVVEWARSMPASDADVIRPAVMSPRRTSRIPVIPRQTARSSGR